MIRSRSFITAACVLLLAHVCTIAWLGETTLGSFLSDFIQLILGLLVFLACFSAASRSSSFSRNFWRLLACSYVVWLTAQGLSTYGDVAKLSVTVLWSVNVLFSFWFVPLAMALFLDQEREFTGSEPGLVLDFTQAVLFCLAAYFYFFYLPRSESAIDLAHSVWEPYFFGYGSLAAAFVVRSFSSHHARARLLFWRMGLFLVLSGSVDAYYYYGPGQQLKTGSWFDLLWSGLLLLPLVTAAQWKDPDFIDPAPMSRALARRALATQLFSLVFPLLTLAMALGIARQRLALGAPIILAAFITSSARLLLTHHELLRTQEALHHEALHDSLTGLLNRKAILDVLARELQRSQRTGAPPGIVLADLDHFKSVNDTHGHATGDLVLRIVGSEIAAALRPYDAVGRYGGEEFLIVAPGCDFKQTWALAERVRLAVINSSISIGSQQLPVTISLGVGTGEALTSEALLHLADKALYTAKHAGRNRVEPTAELGVPVADACSPPVVTKFWL